jgi:hypothetical protein
MGDTANTRNIRQILGGDIPIAAVEDLQTTLDAKAADAAAVKLTGAQTVAGVKTFSSAPLVPDASWSIADTSGLQAALDAKRLNAEAVNTVAGAGAAETLPDVTTATIHLVTLDANCTFTFPTAAAGKSFRLVLVQGGVGSFTVTWPGTVDWVGGAAPTLTTTVAGVDWLQFICADGTNWAGFVTGLDVR